MAIQLVDNFQVNLESPIDTRIIASGSVARDAISYKYEGLRVFDLSDGIAYVWYGGTWSGENSTSITGNGTSNYITKYSTSNTLNDSVIFESTGDILIGTTTPFPSSPAGKLQVNGVIRSNTGGFYGDGANITDISATNITSGTLTLNRLQLTGSAGYIMVRNAGAAYWESPSNLSVASLLNSRTLWGQSFNGTANVSGNITGAGTITFGTQTNKATLTYTQNTTRTIQVPTLSNATSTIAFLEQAQTFTGAQTFTAATNMTSTLTIVLSSVQVLNSTLTSLIVGPNSTGSSLVKVGSSSAGAPSFTWFGDTDTGMYRPASESIGFSAAGSERVRINTSGIRIGTNGVVFKNHVSGYIKFQKNSNGLGFSWGSPGVQKGGVLGVTDITPLANANFTILSGLILLELTFAAGTFQGNKDDNTVLLSYGYDDTDGNILYYGQHMSGQVVDDNTVRIRMDFQPIPAAGYNFRVNFLIQSIS